MIGHELDERDRQAGEQTLQSALQSSKNNQTQHWHNPKTGNSGSIKRLNGYTTSARVQTYWQFTETYEKEGKTYEQTARACRNANGEWQLTDK